MVFSVRHGVRGAVVLMFFGVRHGVRGAVVLMACVFAMLHVLHVAVFGAPLLGVFGLFLRWWGFRLMLVRVLRGGGRGEGEGGCGQGELAEHGILPLRS
jgi:hypothetical protein